MTRLKFEVVQTNETEMRMMLEKINGKRITDDELEKGYRIAIIQKGKCVGFIEFATDAQRTRAINDACTVTMVRWIKIENLFRQLASSEEIPEKIRGPLLSLEEHVFRVGTDHEFNLRRYSFPLPEKREEYVAFMTSARGRDYVMNSFSLAAYKIKSYNQSQPH